MAAASLFHADLASLKASARLSDLPTDGDPNAIFELALGKAQAHIFNSLGASIIATYQAVADVCPPTNADEAKRVLLKTAETDMLLIELLCRLPYGTIDAAAGGYDMFDKEAPFRLMDSLELDALMKKLQAGVDRTLESVGGAPTGEAPSFISYGNPYAPKSIHLASGHSSFCRYHNS